MNQISRSASQYTHIAWTVAKSQTAVWDLMTRAASAANPSDLIDISPFNIDGQTSVPASVALEFARDMKEWQRSLLQMIGREREDDAQWFQQFMQQMQSIMRV